MSYQIYYDKAFIKVEDKFVPMINSGSNNCWEFNSFGQQIPEKNWSVLNYTCRFKLLFSDEEIKEVAKRYEQLSVENGMCFKTRNRCFDAGEFERWILCGMKSALTVEEYTSCGNIINIVDYSNSGIDKLKRYTVHATEEFLNLLDTLKDCKCLNVEYENNRQVYRPKKELRSERIRKLGSFYALKIDSESGSYFCSFRKYNIVFCRTPDFEYARVFESEKEALKYLEKHKDRLGKFKLKPVFIETAA